MGRLARHRVLAVGLSLAVVSTLAAVAIAAASPPASGSYTIGTDVDTPGAVSISSIRLTVWLDILISSCLGRLGAEGLRLGV